MAGPNEIAKAYVVIEPDLSALKSVGTQVKTELKGAGEAADQAGDQMSSAFERAGKRIEDSTAGIRKFAGALSSTVGVLTAVTGAITGLAGVLLLLKTRQEDAQQKALDAARAYNSLSLAVEEYRNTVVKSGDDVGKSTRDILSSIDSQQKAIGKARADALAATVIQIEQEKLLQAQIAETQAAYERASEADLAAKQRQTNAIQAIVDLLEQQQISLLQDDDKLIAQANRQKRIIEETFSTLGVNLPAGFLDQALRNVDTITQRQIDAERERQRIADEAQAKREAEADRRSQERAQREIETLQRGLDEIANSDFLGTFNGLVQALRDIDSSVGRLK